AGILRFAQDDNLREHDNFSPFSRLHQLADLALHQIAFQGAEMADVKLAIEMISLVEEGAGQQVLAGFLEDIAVLILCPYRDLARARHRLAELWNAQAAFILALPPLGVKNLRINQDQLGTRVFFKSDIHDRQPPGNTDLRRGQAHPVSRIHGFEHILYQFFQLLVEDGDRRGGFLQNRIAKLDDGVDHLVVLYLLAVSLKIADRLPHGIAPEFLQRTAGQAQRDHG